jgi:hypothetical protein
MGWLPPSPFLFLEIGKIKKREKNLKKRKIGYQILLGHCTKKAHHNLVPKKLTPLFI